MKQIVIPCKKKLFKHDFAGLPKGCEWLTKVDKRKGIAYVEKTIQKAFHDFLFEVHQLFDANRGFRYDRIEIPEIEPNEDFQLIIDDQLFAVCNYQIETDSREPFLLYIYFEYRKLNMHFFKPIHPIFKPFP